MEAAEYAGKVGRIVKSASHGHVAHAQVCRGQQFLGTFHTQAQYI